MFHWNALDEMSGTVLKLLADHNPVAGSYLAGGTALALQIGHRCSIDLDWFTPCPFETDRVAERLSQLGRLEISETAKGTFHGRLDGVRVTWLHYPNPILEECIDANEPRSLKLASLRDIGVMKWVAASQRGARRDFIDLYMIEGSGHALEALLEAMPRKFPGKDINYYHLIKSLSWFDDADREPQPKMLIPLAWDDVKCHLRKKQKELLEGRTRT